MLMSFIRSLNWVDLIVFLILVRVVFIGIKSGFVIEFFKFLGVLLSVFVCLHYYSALSLLLSRLTFIPEAAAVTLTFVLAWIFMFLICKIIRDGLLMLFTIEAQSFVDKWGGALVGVGRFFVVASMTLFALLLIDSKYIETMVARSASHRYVVPVAPGIYRTVYSGFVAKLFTGEQYNRDVSRQVQKIKTP